MRKLLYFIPVVTFLLVTACSGGDSDGSSAGQPDAALLAFPINNSECNEGTPVSATETKVSFQWNVSENTDSYFLYVKNLSTQTTLQYNAGANTTYDVNLLKGVPYSWYISSRNSDDTTNSAVWKFYNAGNGVVNYAPFPAEVVAPQMSSSVYGPAVNLEWTGSDIDDDIVSYKVYFGTNASPTALLRTVTTPMVSNVAVTSNTNYYWKIVTTDEAGNTSDSPIFQFKAL